MGLSSTTGCWYWVWLYHGGASEKVSWSDPFSPKRATVNSKPIAVVLAAGRGTRMKSDLPKVLVPVLGRPMVHWVLDALQEAGFHKQIVVIGYRGDDVKLELKGRSGIEFAVQTEQLGTGHATDQCRPLLESHNGPVLVVAGDSPMIRHESLKRLLNEFEAGSYSCLLGTLVKQDPAGLGRIVRDADGRFSRIVEHKDASPEQLAIREVNMSTYLFQCQDLLWALSKMDNRNSQGEYYLTDCPEILLKSGKLVDALPVLQACEALSINTMEELQLVEATMQEMGYTR
jgi:bifunctional UDP-N-acetylglucosamine pyrophosphorylase / glucosamine-1-phosphate N-acetyltransferase